MLKIFRRGKARSQAPSATLLARARQELEGGQPAQARILLGFGEILAGESGGPEGAVVEYLLAAGRLWQEFGNIQEAKAWFLKAEGSSKGTPLGQATQVALRNLDSTLVLQPAETKQTLLEVTAPIRKPEESDGETLFVWLQTNRCLWMPVGEEFANRVEAIVGTKMLIDLVARCRRWRKGKAEDHAALRVPDGVEGRERAFARLRRFFTLNIQLDVAAGS